MSVDLSDVPTPALEKAHRELARARPDQSLSELELKLWGLGHALKRAPALLQLSPHALALLLEATLAERRRRPERDPLLVWTGPEAKASNSRDTRVVVRELFSAAKQNVLIAGFRFDHASTLLEPLHAAMRDRHVSCHLFADRPDGHEFLQRHWSFGPPFPEVYVDAREDPGFSSLHSKCVVVDDAQSFVTSANFTDRGQRRNIEVGLLVESREVAVRLREQWLGLISAGHFKRVG